MPSTLTINVSAEHLPASKFEYVYLIAESDVVFSEEVPALKSYYKEHREGMLDANLFECHQFTQDDLRYKGMAPFANQLREVTFHRYGDCAQISIDGTPACQLLLNENRIHVINGESYDSELNLELLTGPALILLLTQQNTFCLHAAAVRTDFGNIAIVAESGAGKSTLSKHVDDAWCQLADDILPLQHGQLLSNFPQLKCTNAVAQGRLKGAVNLNAIIRINPEPSSDFEFVTLSSMDAMLQIIRHTVASKLFGASLLKEHTKFAKNLASQIPVIEIRYPRDLSQLPSLRKAITNHLSSELKDAPNAPSKSF